MLFVLGLALHSGPVAAQGAFTAHQFSVTESGAATLSVPVQIPRGIAGMEPQLSLGYMSGAGNGLLGLGWSLGGVSAITRCPRSLLHDNARGSVDFTGNDRFCLDGQRLVLAVTGQTYGAAGTEYRTERDSFSRILAVGTYAGQSLVPTGFTVETKAGLLLEFGGTADAQVLTQFTDGSTNTINRWHLKRISDRMPSPSSIEFTYCAGLVSSSGSSCTAQANGSAVLHVIRYTHRGTTLGDRAVLFGYEDRPDQQVQFHAGSRSVQKQRLSVVDTYLGFASPASPGTRVRRYTLSYEPLVNSAGQSVRATNTSRLSQVTEWSGDLTESLPPLSFSYAPDRVYDRVVAQTPGGTSAAPDPFRPCGGVANGRVIVLCP